MKLSKLSVLFYVILIFLSGAAVGALGFRLYTVNSVSATTTRRPEEWRKRYLDEMTARLHLNAGQLKNLNAILDETRTRFQEARERQRPEMDAIKQQQVGKIRMILDDQQKAEYEKMRQEREAREKAQGHPPGPGI
jgi:hypothetical protein